MSYASIYVLVTTLILVFYYETIYTMVTSLSYSICMIIMKDRSSSSPIESNLQPKSQHSQNDHMDVQSNQEGHSQQREQEEDKCNVQNKQH